MRLAHVAASSRSDPHIGPAIVPAARIEDAISADGHRNRHLAVAVGMPQELTGFRVIRVDPGIGIDDQLVSAARCNQKRGAVGTKPLSPIRFPDLFPGSPVEREQIGRRIVIAEQDQGILIHDWRAAMAPEQPERRVLPSQAAFPGQTAVQSESDQLSGSEPRIDTFSIGDRAWSREVVECVDRREGLLCRNPMFPKKLSLLTPKTL